MRTGSSNEGVNRLGRVLREQMKGMGERPPLLDFASIEPDMSLKLNTFPEPIPQTDYVVCRSVAFGAVDSVIITTQQGGGSPHTHEILADDKTRWLQPGDRVLVAWVGDDPCVIDLILPATEIT